MLANVTRTSFEFFTRLFGNWDNRNKSIKIDECKKIPINQGQVFHYLLRQYQYHLTHSKIIRVISPMQKSIIDYWSKAWYFAFGQMQLMFSGSFYQFLCKRLIWHADRDLSSITLLSLSQMTHLISQIRGQR